MMRMRNGNLSGVVVLVLLLADGAVAAPMRRPNVLFIAIDDLRPELGTYGAPALTPNMDRLAAEGIRFDHAYTEVAACRASRAGMLTGTYAHTTHVLTMFPPLSEANPELTTMPQVFKEAGYETIEIGKFLHTIEDAPTAWSREHWVPPSMKPPDPQLPGDRAEAVASTRRGPMSESSDVPDDFYPDGQRARRAIEELRRLGDRPFFLALGFQRPHLPFNCPEKYWNLYDRYAIEVPGSTDMAGVASPEFHGNYEIARYSDGARIEPQKMIHGYRACISYIDAQVGLVLAELERLEQAESTIVVLWGDHGWHLGEHGIWGKFTLLESSLRIPLIVRVPGLTNGESTGGFVETVDILPTLCELTGLQPPAQVQGLSFVPLIKQPHLPWKQAVFGSRGSVPVQTRFALAGLAVRTPRYRLVRWAVAGAANARFTELYDHDTDPREYTNLAEQPKHQTRVFLMNSMIDAWLRGEPVGHPARD